MKEVAVSTPALRQGWLQKRSPTWPHMLQRRWFVLTYNEYDAHLAEVRRHESPPPYCQQPMTLRFDSRLQFER